MFNQKNLIMYQINYSNSFVPSIETRRFGMFTKKLSFSSHGVNRPGIFSMTGYPTLAFLVMAIIVLEGTALYLSKEEGVTSIIIFSIIIVDFMVAALGHLFVKKGKLAENEAVFTDGVVLEKVRKSIKKARAYQLLFHAAIIFLGGLKVYFFLDHYLHINESITGLALSVSVFYIVAAVLHVFATGYFIFTSIFLFRMWQEYGRYVESGGKKYSFDPKNPIKSYFETEMELIPAQVGKHSLKKEGYKWVIETNGLLMDHELDEMIGKQHTPAQKHKLSLEGVRHQFNMV